MEVASRQVDLAKSPQEVVVAEDDEELRVETQVAEVTPNSPFAAAAWKSSEP